MDDWWGGELPNGAPPRSSRRVLAAGLAGGLVSALAQGIGGERAEAKTPRRPFPQHVKYAAGTIAPNHRRQAQLDDDVRAAYGRWKTRYLVRVDEAARAKSGRSPLYRVALGKPGSANHASTVSEGQGYGMMTVALMAGHDPDAQTIFDGLWRFAREHRSCNDNRLMLWRIPNRSFGCSSATDGDLDIAYGLLLAHAQWGSGGAIDYATAARGVIAGLLGSAVGPRSRLPLLGDWVEPDGDRYNQWTVRTSDVMPGHFRAFRRATGDRGWKQVADAPLKVVQTIQEQFSRKTGLLPDFVQPVSASDHAPRPAQPGFLEGEFDGAYNYNAGRDPWRLGMDALLNADATSLRAAARISAWALEKTGGKPHRLRAGYRLDGTPLPNSDYFTTFFAAPLGVAAMTVPSQQRWLNALHDAVRDVNEDYYEDSVTLLCLLVMSRNVWDPTV